MIPKQEIFNFLKKHQLTVFIVLIVGILILAAFAFLPREKETPSLATVPEDINEIVKPGAIGEVSEKAVEENDEASLEESSTVELPPMIFNTAGIIITVGDNRLSVQGSGSNFADQKSRILTVLFTESTKTTLPGQKIKYQGLDGLKYLKPGMEIMIDGETNIRGRTEIIARYINIL